MSPYMGWSSWNDCGINVTEDRILDTANQLKKLGLFDLGYNFINIDDGFFSGRDSDGNIIVDPHKFPNGMRTVLQNIKSQGFKTGIYSDAGKHTCGYFHDHHQEGKYCGLEGHDEQDIDTYLVNWDCDLLKVDWCGGWMRLNKKNRYTEISEIIRRRKPDAIYNVCCWQWPGQWVTEVADCWRIAPDLQPKFSSIMDTLHAAKNLNQYSSVSKWNDLDMLQVGNGMTLEEDRSHFTMWAVMNTPLVLGTDLSRITPDLLDIISNKEILDLHKDPLGKPAVKVKTSNDVSIWSKPLVGNRNAFVLLNESPGIRMVQLPVASRIKQLRDVWNKTNIHIKGNVTVRLSPHAVSVLVSMNE
ncbi:alpha-galactosidase [Tetraselmis virus 1]|uniref:Alpha-galactosidase n=1 Tax=Tetraselmis virus 1 TaxID=2060617 RepID=A0A2P0VP48_9VIRU|nr:alpha-galactosidase [Tetraselmis virus 1]AUF82683.1 alpha-galactosidase [Tetraselmis virus 1]